MNAKDDFSEYTFYNNSGDFNVKKMPNSGNWDWGKGWGKGKGRGRDKVLGL